MEVWKNIKGYAGEYQVSTLGRVKSIKSNKILKQAKYLHDGHGYYWLVVLCKNGKIKTNRTHRLVAQAFIPNPENKPSINHIDGVKSNNFYKNLEWCTPKENTAHAQKNGLMKTKSLKPKINIKIHEGFNKALIAEVYYKENDRPYSREQARKQFHQDQNIDKKTLRMVFKKIYKEQNLLLKKV